MNAKKKMLILTAAAGIFALGACASADNAMCANSTADSKQSGKTSPGRNKPLILSTVDRPSGIEIMENVRFSPTCPDPEVLLDVYYPKKIDKTNPVPCLLLIHGGGWRMGDQKKYALMAAYMASKGYVVASTTYRLLPEYDIKDSVEDCQRALLWLKENASKFGGDASKVGVMGGSAGGHLSALLATGGGDSDLCGEVFKDPKDAKVQACVAMAPIADLSTNKLARRLGFKGDKNEAWKLSGLKYVSKDSPPMLLLHSKGDKTVDPAESEKLHSAYNKAGAKSEKIIYDYNRHAFWNLGLDDDFKMTSWNDALKFFDKILKNRQ